MPRTVMSFDTVVTAANRNCTCGEKPAAGWIVRLLSMSTVSAISAFCAISIVSPAPAPVTQAWSVELQGAAPGYVYVVAAWEAAHASSIAHAAAATRHGNPADRRFITHLPQFVAAAS